MRVCLHYCALCNTTRASCSYSDFSLFPTRRSYLRFHLIYASDFKLGASKSKKFGISQLNVVNQLDVVVWKPKMREKRQTYFDNTLLSVRQSLYRKWPAELWHLTKNYLKMKNPSLWRVFKASAEPFFFFVPQFNHSQQTVPVQYNIEDKACTPEPPLGSIGNYKLSV